MSALGILFYAVLITFGAAIGGLVYLAMSRSKDERQDEQTDEVE